MTSNAEISTKCTSSNTRNYDHTTTTTTLQASEVSRMKSLVSEVTITNNSISRAADDHICSCVSMEETPMTPTTPSHRIPDTTGLCPPAPRKPKSRPFRKRKCSSSDGCGNSNSNNNNVTRLLDFSKEIESMYPPFLQANFGRKIKKARSI